MTEIQKKAYTLARLPIGFSFLGHGLVRIPKLNAFAVAIAHGFDQTILPNSIVLAFAYVLPFVELTLGLFLLFGIRMKLTASIGVALICILIFGSSLQENWSAIAIQMFYGVYLSILYLYVSYNINILQQLKK